MKISKATVDALEAGAKDNIWWDTELTGFGVKVTPAGRKVYVAEYRKSNGKSGRYTIGRHGLSCTAAEARKKAAAVLFSAREGVDPNAEKRRKRKETMDYSFAGYADFFIQRYLRIEWVGSHDRAESIIRRHAKPFFKKQDIREIARRDCTAFLDGLAHMPATARKAAEVVGKMFRWAEVRDDIERSPMDRVPAPKPSAGRTRVLSDDELRRIWHAATSMSDHPYGALIQMLALTGQRRGELAGMRWDELDLKQKVWEVPPDRTKSGRGNVIPLTAQMLDVLDKLPRLGPLVFSVTGERVLGNHSKLKARLDARLFLTDHTALPAWTLHDLRRTAATGMQRLGISSDMIEVVQGRTKKLGAGLRYQRYDYLVEKREALMKWCDHVLEVVGMQALAHAA